MTCYPEQSGKALPRWLSGQNNLPLGADEGRDLMTINEVPLVNSNCALAKDFASLLNKGGSPGYKGGKIHYQGGSNGNKGNGIY